MHRGEVGGAKGLPRLTKHGCAVTGMHILPDGRTLVSTGSDGVIRRWDLKTGKPAAEPESYEGLSRAAYSRDGRFVGIGDGLARIDLWDGRSVNPILTIQHQRLPVSSLPFAPHVP